jgi:hypothetical protein
MVAALMGAKARAGYAHHNDYESAQTSAEKKKNTTITAQSFDHQVADTMGDFLDTIFLPAMKKLVQARMSSNEVKKLVQISSMWGAKITGEQFQERATLPGESASSSERPKTTMVRLQPQGRSSPFIGLTIFPLIGCRNPEGREALALSSIRTAVLSALLLGCTTPLLLAAAGRITAIERFGIGGYIQPIGLHHGFHIERVTAGSPAEKDKLRPHDVIVRVDGEAIRSLDHLRALLAEAYADDGEVTITYQRGLTLTHHDIRCQLKAPPAKVAGKKPRIESDESDGIEIR